MIKFKPGIARRRLYLYEGQDAQYTNKYLPLPILAERTECVISKATLSQRLSLAINRAGVYCWVDTIQCMSTPKISGHPKFCHRPKRKEPVCRYDSDFIDLMMTMPIGSLWRIARPMQSRGIR